MEEMEVVHGTYEYVRVEDRGNPGVGRAAKREPLERLCSR